MPGKTYNHNMVVHSFSFYPKKSTINNYEIDYIQSMLKKEKKFSNRRIMRAIDSFEQAKRHTNRWIIPTNNTKITRALLLVGKVQFGQAMN